MRVKIKQEAGETTLEELTLDGKPVDLNWLTNISLDMEAGERSKVTLTYWANEVDIDVADVDFEEEPRDPKELTGERIGLNKYK